VKNCKVSVIICTYNRKSIVEEAIQSVLQQTYLDYELIVIDDGSTDGTTEYLQRTYPSIKVVFQENKGISAARNLGIRLAQGEWICFLDSDDLWTPKKLEEQLAKTDQQKTKISYTNEIWYRSGKRVNPSKKHQKYSGDIFKYCLPLCIISASSVMIHPSVFDKVGGFDEDLPACEDYDLWLRMASQYAISYFPDVFILKRNGVDQNHLSQTYWGMDRFRLYALGKLLTTTPLSPLQIQLTQEELQKKKGIFENGAKKRGKNPGHYALRSGGKESKHTFFSG